MKAIIAEIHRQCIACKLAKLHKEKLDHEMLLPRKSPTANSFDIVRVDIFGPCEGDNLEIEMIDSADRWQILCTAQKNNHDSYNFDRR